MSNKGNYFQQALAISRDADDPLANNAVYFEYTKAADPFAAETISPITPLRFGPELYNTGPSRVVPLDASSLLDVPGPATSPALCASFVRINEGDAVNTEVAASSQLFYVISGRGTSFIGHAKLEWRQGDFFAVPAGSGLHEHRALADSTIYWVHDGPLMRYFGADPTRPRFTLTHYRHSDVQRALDQVVAEPDATSRSRISVLLANRDIEQTLTVTHVHWAMYGIIPSNSFQPPHRHQSVALDLILACEPGCYTLLADRDDTGHLVNVERIDWEPYSSFVTPPGKWHSHHNESGSAAHVIPIQDAGFQTYLRSLDIQFMTKEQASAAWDLSLNLSLS
jgi:gentisate 1,2-dioxygenase